MEGVGERLQLRLELLAVLFNTTFDDTKSLTLLPLLPHVIQPISLSATPCSMTHSLLLLLLACIATSRSQEMSTGGV